MTPEQILRQLPSMDVLLKSDEIHQYISLNSHVEVKEHLKHILNKYRQDILQGNQTEVVTLEMIQAQLRQALEDGSLQDIQRVVNATGTIIHTNLGRSNLFREVSEKAQEIASHYSNLEYDLAQGKRGGRYASIQEKLHDLTGAEDALVVNNNAAAVLLVLSTMSKNKEIIVSRGELVEIGGSFRIPDVIRQSGGELVEVGATNKTHLKDYQAAISENTSVLLKVHTSNYRIIGFSQTVEIDDLAHLSQQEAIPLVCDLGSGSFIDFSQYGLPYEPTVQECIQKGCDVVTFSGDKLLGGPQAGIIVGKKSYIEQMKSHPLMRALRVDKMTLAALDATLAQYYNIDQAIENIPTLRMITMSKEACLERAQYLCDQLSFMPKDWTLNIVETKSSVGGGAYPEQPLDSFAISIKHKEFPAEYIQEKLRFMPVPVISRIFKEMNLLDIRTISDDDMSLVISALQSLVN